MVLEQKPAAGYRQARKIHLQWRCVLHATVGFSPTEDVYHVAAPATLKSRPIDEEEAENQQLWVILDNQNATPIRALLSSQTINE